MQAEHKEIFFEWDDEKEKQNIRKHGIDFDTATGVFADDARIERVDWKHSTPHELRMTTIGMLSDYIIVLTVVYVERGDVLRIISARRATAREKEEYYGN